MDDPKFPEIGDSKLLVGGGVTEARDIGYGVCLTMDGCATERDARALLDWCHSLIIPRMISAANSSTEMAPQARLQTGFSYASGGPDKMKEVLLAFEGQTLQELTNLIGNCIGKVLVEFVQPPAHDLILRSITAVAREAVAANTKRVKS